MTHTLSAAQPAAAQAVLAAQPHSWTAHDSRLLAALVTGIALIVVLITWLKLHPFLSLAVGSAVLGVIAGMPITDLADTFTKGLGETVGDVGLLVALGAMLGKLLTDTGGADQIVDTVLRHTTNRRLPWAMLLVAALLGLPMFMEIGVVLLIPIVMMVVQRSEQSVLRIGIPTLAGLSILHGLVPPHPGPLVAVQTLHVDLGLTLGLGILVAIPTGIVAGPLFGSLIARRIQLTPTTHLFDDTTERQTTRRPSFALSVIMLLLPVALMLCKSVADLALTKDSTAYDVLDTLGTPVVAMMLTVLIAAVTLGRAAGLQRGPLSAILGNALPSVAGIILIIGAGGGLKQTLTATKVDHTITDLAQGAHVAPLVLAWLVAVGIRVATGSATVATTTAAGMVAPMAIGLDPVHGALIALAIGSGSLFFSHVNDAGFWMVKEYFGMTVGQTLRSWSVMETLLSVLSFAIIGALDLLL